MWRTRHFDIDFQIAGTSRSRAGCRREYDDRLGVGRLLRANWTAPKPLWELWFIENLADGRAAIATKIAYHAVIDGILGAGISEILFDITPEPRAPSVDVDRSLVGVSIPRPELRMISGLINVGIRTPYRITRLVEQTVRQQLATRGIANKPPRYFDAPTTRFNAPISPHRRISGASVSLDRVKAVKEAYGVKLNDVVLTLVSGALREYLSARGELPDKSLVSQVPVSTRGEGNKDIGNQISTMTISLASDLADPAERIKAIYANSQGAKEMAKALTAHQIMDLTERRRRACCRWRLAPTRRAESAVTWLRSTS